MIDQSIPRSHASEPIYPMRLTRHPAPVSRNKNNLLLELDGSRRLAGVVVADAAHAVDRVDDAGGALGQELGGEGVRVGRHEVGGLDGAQQDDVLVDALVAHDADGAAGVQGRERLPDLVVQAGLPDHADEDVVGLAHHLDALGRRLAQDADGDARARERVPHHQHLGDAELPAHLAHLVLEQLAERLQQPEAVALGHARGEAAHVVVRLDRLAGPLEGQRFYDVWVSARIMSI